ncbi:hypothetical protein LCGC14_0364040 [marine sediment metagenome]|uniref:Uncharacterized protein n=1 Tax=marine sediment metagenome TaxID=412755 RepID=A0A0F9T748_9ZZZZ
MIVPPEYIDEYAKCAADKWHFISNYAQISDPSEGIISLAPWLHLQQLTQIIDANDRVIILKARQIGITWLVCAIALWYVTFKHSSNVLMFSRRETESIGMKNRVVFMHGLLPEWLQIPFDKNNDQLVNFPLMNSKIQSFPATEGSGRMENASIVFLDEWAFQQYAEVNFTAILPVVEHGKLVGLSTANGKNNTFHRIWIEAKKKLNSFIPVFIPYTVRPGRDEAWHKKQESDMAAYMAWQEYPLKEADAFLVAGTCMFAVQMLHEMPVCSPSRQLGPAEIWVEYDPEHTYVAGIDTALGIAGRDYSVLQIIDVTLGCQAAKIHTQIPIEQFSDEALKLLSMYNFPMTNIEEQPQGRLVVKVLTDGTDLLGRHPKHRIYHRSKNIPCWHTTHDNRQELLSGLEQAIRTGALSLFSESTINEMLGFGYNEEENKFEGLSGNDDEVMSLALAWHMSVNQPAPIGDLTPKSYVDGKAHREGEPVIHIDWGKSNPFEGTKTIICWTCEDIPEERAKCRTCRGRGKVLVYAS